MFLSSALLIDHTAHCLKSTEGLIEKNKQILTIHHINQSNEVSVNTFLLSQSKKYSHLLSKGFKQLSQNPFFLKVIFLTSSCLAPKCSFFYSHQFERASWGITVLYALFFSPHRPCVSCKAYMMITVNKLSLGKLLHTSIKWPGYIKQRWLHW